MTRIKHFFYWICAFFALLVLSFFWLESVHAPEQEVSTIRLQLIGLDGTVVHLSIEIADDAAEQSRGLMFRESLPKGEGMLFVFREEQELNFWMKNTRIPLDILYFNAQKKFVSRTSMDPCLNDPCTSYPSRGKASYALEVNRGEVTTKSVGIGWRLDC